MNPALLIVLNPPIHIAVHIQILELEVDSVADLFDSIKLAMSARQGAAQKAPEKALELN